jgi:hypothetical protein
MLASFPASMLNQTRADSGIPNRFCPKSSRSSTYQEPDVRPSKARPAPGAAYRRHINQAVVIEFETEPKLRADSQGTMRSVIFTGMRSLAIALRIHSVEQGPQMFSDQGRPLILEHIHVPAGNPVNRETVVV